MRNTNLKAELQSLVKDFRLNSTLIVDLASNAFDDLVVECKTVAMKGESTVHVPITFTGCRGGYQNLIPDVLKHLRVILDNEDITYTIFSTPNSIMGVDIRQPSLGNHCQLTAK